MHFRPPKALGPVSVRRRCAAGGCADAQHTTCKAACTHHDSMAYGLALVRATALATMRAKRAALRLLAAASRRSSSSSPTPSMKPTREHKNSAFAREARSFCSAFWCKTFGILLKWGFLELNFFSPAARFQRRAGARTAIWGPPPGLAPPSPPRAPSTD